VALLRARQRQNRLLIVMAALLAVLVAAIIFD